MLSGQDGSFGGNSGTHPDAERLAEYADDLLSPAARADVEAHLVACETCREVLADTIAVTAIADEPVNPPIAFRAAKRPGWRWKPVFAAGLAAAAVLVVAVVVTGRWRRVETVEMGELIAAVSSQPTRPFEGRLSGGFAYAPAPPVIRGSAAGEVPPEIRIAAGRIEQRAGRQDTAASAAASGVASGIAGNLDSAIQALERAVSLDPGNARYQSDLSALQLARGRQRNTDDLTEALASAERALALEPRLGEGCFNRALALEYLARRDEARAAWQECQPSTNEPGWSREIQQHLDRLATEPAGNVEPT